MDQNTQKQSPNIESFATWFVDILKKQGVILTVKNENCLNIYGEMTLAQKENIKLWKRQIINHLSPKCSNCNLPMNLIDDGKVWFCPIGCQSVGVDAK